MLDLTTVSKELHDLLVNAPTLQGVAIEEAEYANENPDIAANGWIGVYEASKEYDPRTLSKHTRSWQASIEMSVLVQYAAWNDGKAARKGLEELLEKVEQIVVDNPQLKNAVEMVTGLSVEYDYRRTSQETLYFRQAILTIEAEKASG